MADYTELVAHKLAGVGDAVSVYTSRADSPTPGGRAGVAVVRLPDHYGVRGLAHLDAALARSPRPDRILVQYVPHAYGLKAMNLPFAAWVAERARRIAPVWVMFHEVAFPFAWRPAKHAGLAAATRLMARLVAGSASRVFVSIPAWGEFLKRLCPHVPRPEWLPVPCNVAVAADPAAVAAIRERFAQSGGPLVGHFGTYGPQNAQLLDAALAELRRLVPNVGVLLVGRGGDRFVAERPAFAGNVAATGDVAGAAVAAHLRACDLLLQPYPDGVSSRRGSAMAGLANGVPLVTTLGALSEPVWAATGVASLPTPDPLAMARAAAALLADPAARADLGRRGETLYRGAFALEHTVATLRGGGS